MAKGSKKKQSTTNGVVTENDFEEEFNTLRSTYLDLSEQINTFCKQIESLEDERKNVMKKITVLQKKLIRCQCLVM